VTNTRMEVTDNGASIKIFKVTDNNTRIRIFSLKEAEGEDQMTNQAYNVITAKNMGTMNLNVGRRKQIISQAKNMCQIIREKPQKVCFSHAKRLKNNLKISDCWTVDASIT
jgi:competence CoiA-like predicted nuclease